MKQTLIILFSLCFNPLLHSQTTTPTTIPIAGENTNTYAVHFAPDGSSLTQEEENKLLNFLTPLADRIVDLSLSGHTDGDGTEEYNISLSLARAESVRACLEQNGFVVGTYSYRGESQPLASNSTSQGKAINRRVDVLLSLTPDAVPQTYSLQEVLDYCMPKEQQFCIDNRKDTTFMCDDGTIIRIPAFAFEHYNSDKCVEISVIEALSMRDMVLASLATTSNGMPLESGGTIRIRAAQDGKELTLAADKPATIFIPATRPVDDMLVFYADDDMNWNASNSPFNYLTGRVLLDLSTYLDYEVSWTKCHFLFCRIRRAFEPKMERRVLLNGSVRSSKYVEQASMTQDQVDAMLELYGVENLEALQAVLEEEQKKIDELNYFISPISQFGWINCDRFLDFRNITNVTAECPEPSDNPAYMILPRYNCVMKADDRRHSLLWQNVPVGAKVKVVSINVERGQPLLALYEGKLEKGDRLDLDYVTLAPEEMKKAIEKFVR